MIKESFTCKKLKGTLAYATCLKRQEAVTSIKAKKPVYLQCNPQCEQGIQIRAMFPEYKVEMKKKLKQIALKPGNGRKPQKKKSQVSHPRLAEAREKKREHRRGKEAEPEINLYDLELLLKAQVSYIMSLCREGRLGDAIKRLKLIVNTVGDSQSPPT